MLSNLGKCGMAHALCDQILCMMQAGGCAWLIYELNRRHPLQAAGAAALADTVTVVLQSGSAVWQPAALPMNVSAVCAAQLPRAERPFA
jgi:hypothetical protein